MVGRRNTVISAAIGTDNQRIQDAPQKGKLKY